MRFKPGNRIADQIRQIDWLAFQLQRATAIGSGIIVSLATIFPDAGIDVSALTYGRYPPRGAPLDPARNAEKSEFKPVAEIPASEQLPSAPLVIAAYAFVWLAFTAYAWTMWRKLGKVEQELHTLSAQIGKKHS